MISSSHPQNQLTPAQMQAQQQQQAIASDRAKLRSRKPTDKNVPEGVEDVIIGDGVQRYRELRDVERRMDAVMMRKRLDLGESVNRNIKVCVEREKLVAEELRWGRRMMVMFIKIGANEVNSATGLCESGSAILLKTNLGKQILLMSTLSISVPTWTLPTGSRSKVDFSMMKKK
jgi:hypothetical protein